MNRFASLEFDDADPPSKRESPGEPVRDAPFFYRQAMLAWLGGDWELGLRNYSRALERNHALFEAWSGQVMMLIELGEYPEAQVWADKALELFPEHPELLAEKAIACVRDEKLTKAMAYSDNAVSKDRLTWRVWLSRAEVVMRRKGRLAEECVHKAVTLGGGSVNVTRLEAGRVLSMHGRYAAALEYLERAVKDFPKSPLAWYELGRCQSQLGLSQAAASLQQALYLRPDWPCAVRQMDRTLKAGLLIRVWRRLLGR
ncbi:MAG: tetratricopeptide repeat protein [Phycisphaerae bacterium]|nr:tetratricopeptide repeat protein [Phycisphaerae bacterium]